MVDPTERRTKAGHQDQSDDVDLDRRDSDGRRQSVRMSLRIWTEGRVRGRIDFFNCSNVSRGGLFIETTEPYPVGEQVHLEFNLPGQYEPVRVLARVVSVLNEDTAAENMMGNGFEFVDAKDEDLGRIEQWIDQQLTDPDPSV